MSISEKKIDGETVYKGKILNLDVDRVELTDGRISKREIIRHSGGASVLYVENGQVLLVRQFRYAYGKEILEIPAGKLNAGENPADAAARELEEETGYRPGKLVPMLEIYPTPGYTDEIIYVYFAENCKFVGQKLDEGEFLNCGFYALEEVLNKIESGDINDAKTIAAIYKYCLNNSER